VSWEEENITMARRAGVPKLIISRPGFAVGLLIALAVGVTTAGYAALSLTAAGATFPYPIYSKWFDAYHKLHPYLEINSQSVGSGGGIRQVIAGTVDFGASDGPMSDDQLASFKQKRSTDILHFPTVLGAAVPAYNIPGVKGTLRFTPEALSGIFLGTI